MTQYDPAALAHLRGVVRRGLETTAALWPSLRVAHGWVRDVARILDNEAGHDGAAVRTLVRAQFDAMRAERATADPLGAMAAHNAKVTASYGPGLFRFDDVPDLARTNNELERCFGLVRYHERRVTGWRTITGGVIVRGPVLLAMREGYALGLRLTDRAVGRICGVASTISGRRATRNDASGVTRTDISGGGNNTSRSGNPPYPASAATPEGSVGG